MSYWVWGEMHADATQATNMSQVSQKFGPIIILSVVQAPSILVTIQSRIFIFSFHTSARPQWPLSHFPPGQTSNTQSSTRVSAVKTKIHARTELSFLSKSVKHLAILKVTGERRTSRPALDAGMATVIIRSPVGELGRHLTVDTNGLRRARYCADAGGGGVAPLTRIGRPSSLPIWPPSRLPWRWEMQGQVLRHFR